MAYGGSQRIGPNLNIDLKNIIPHLCPLRPSPSTNDNENNVSYILDRVVLNKDFLKQQEEIETHPAFQCRIGNHIAPDFVFPWMQALLNAEIAAGDTYPFEDEMDYLAFQNYFFAQDTFLLYRSRNRTNNNNDSTTQDQISQLTSEDLVGCFYIKSNFPGRSRHVCNAGFLVSVSYRNRGSGFVMGERLRHLAKALGYKRIMFNLVYSSNIASNKLWPKLGFEQIGVLKGAGRLRTHNQEGGRIEEEYVDAVLWEFDLTVESIPAILPSWTI